MEPVSKPNEFKDVSKLSIAEEGPRATNEQDKFPLPMTSRSTRPPRNSKMARDITSEFRAAASALNTGQLVKDEYFTLFESVAALEIMDPKMDSGHLEPGETLEDGYDVLKELLPEEVIGIMDQILCYEMAWHRGSPLSQSLFTSLYLDRMLWPEPKTLEEARFDRERTPGPSNRMLHLVLRAYCLGLIKTCDFVHRKISSEHYYEVSPCVLQRDASAYETTIRLCQTLANPKKEEDFVANLYNRNLFTEFSVADISKKMDDAIAYVEKDSSTSMNETLKAGLRNRLELRQNLLRAVQLNDIVDSQRVMFWERCLELLPTLSQTNKLGKPVLDSFSIKIQRRLASSVPPRPLISISFDDAFTHLSRQCHNAKDAYRVLDYHGGSHLLNFVWAYQCRIPQPSIYIRCLLQSLIFSEMRVLGTMSFKQLLFDDLDELVLPADLLLDLTNGDVEAPQDPRFQIAKKMDAFAIRAADPYLDIFRTLCMNRSRLRRMLCHLVLEWDSVQFEAEGVDTDLRNFTKEQPMKDSQTSSEEIWAFPLSSWAYYHKLRQMEWIVQMGFELDIYQVDELAGMYWYLQHLASIRIQHLERIRTFSIRRIKRVSKPTFEEKTAHSRSISFLEFAMLEASATQSFADGLSCLFSFLAHMGLVPVPYHALAFSTPSQRYTLRMRPFLPVSLPEVPSYRDFASLVSLRTPDPSNVGNATPASTTQAEINAQAVSILDVADQALKVARREWEALSKAKAETARCVPCEDWWRTSVKDVLRACITANIMVATAKKALANAGSKNAHDMLKIEIGESGKGYHAWWIVPKIAIK